MREHIERVGENSFSKSLAAGIEPMDKPEYKLLGKLFWLDYVDTEKLKEGNEEI